MSSGHIVIVFLYHFIKLGSHLPYQVYDYFPKWQNSAPDSCCNGSVYRNPHTHR